MIPSSSSVLQCCAVRKERPRSRAKASPKTETMFGDEGAVPAFVGPSNGQSSRLTSVRFRSMQILQGMFALISIPPHLGDCCRQVVRLASGLGDALTSPHLGSRLASFALRLIGTFSLQR